MIDIENKTNFDETVWKYFKTERFIDTLKTSSIYFPSARQFEDKFEGACYISQTEMDTQTDPFLERAFEDLRRMTKVSCWHISQHESDAMWKLYAGSRKGLAICTTPSRMRESFVPYRIKPEFGIEKLRCGPIEYIDLSKTHLTTSFLNTFYRKHVAFSWEREFRLTISLRLASEYCVTIPTDGIFVKVDLCKLIDKIILGPNLTEDEAFTIRKHARQAGLEDKLEYSTLTYIPYYAPKAIQNGGTFGGTFSIQK